MFELYKGFCFSMAVRNALSSLTNARSYHKVSSIFPKPMLPSKDSTLEQSECLSQDLFLRGELISRASPGSFYMAPDMVRSLEKLYRIIDNEMHSIGAQKVFLPCLAPGDIWQKSKRWDEMGSELLKLADRQEKQHCLAPTHEEAVTNFIAPFRVSHKHLPIKWYQIGRKFRDEMRPKHGLLRCREFEMKDLYCFDVDEEHARKTYDDVSSAYERIYKRLGLDVVRVAASSGAMGGHMSHEYHLVSDIGEDSLLQCTSCGTTVNEELFAGSMDTGITCTAHCSNCQQNVEFKRMPAIEVSHSFLLGTKYSEVFDATYTCERGTAVPYYMSCYGIGVTRLLAAAVQVRAHDQEINWPAVIAPYQVAVVPQRKGFKFEETFALTENLCSELTRFGHLMDDVILDDRCDVTIGRRVSSMRTLGVPHVVVVGKRSLEKPALYEYIDVRNDRVTYLKDTELMGLLSTLDTVVLNSSQQAGLSNYRTAAVQNYA